MASTAVAQENDDCFMCHSDPDLEELFVDPDVYAATMHAELDCVMCHQDLSGAELPHEGGLEPVDCSLCHDSQAAQHAASLHGMAAARGDDAAPTCGDCHGKHDIRSHNDPAAPTAVINIPLLCGNCHREGSPVSRTHEIHKERPLENYSMSMHGEGLFELGLTVTAVCTSCHTSHTILPHTDPESSIHHDNIAKTCARCHGQIEVVHRKVIEGRLWREEPTKIPSCVDCHAPHKIRRVFYPAGLANKDCLKCHGDPELAMDRDGERTSLFVDEMAYAASAHSNTGCAQCHTDVTASLERACETVASSVDCSVCHAGPVTDFQTSTHGSLLATGDPDAPGCFDCHVKHAELKKENPASPTFARNIPTLCGRCHRVGEKAAVRIDSEVADIVGSYEDSIHGRGLVQSGLVVTATCADCHSPHLELPPGNPDSLVHPANIADTCGKCHHGIEETFLTSVHWPGNTDTDKELPTCEDCHSSHTISRIDKADFRTNIMSQCGRCHTHEAETFFDTFHGKVSRLGGDTAAKCHDCHGTHQILPVENPDSSLNRNQVVETCGQCHEGSHRQFAGYLTHATHHDQDKYPWLFWSFWGMTVLLVGTLTFALLHTFAWLIRLWLTRDQWKAHKEAAANLKPGEKLYRRFNRFQRTQHFVMLISFFVLALTGMALKFSYMGWARGLSRALGGFHTMGILHRMGGVALFAIFFVHLWGVWRRKRQIKQSWWEMLTSADSIVLNLRDLKEVRESIKWFFGVGPRPHYGRYTYWEKFDYLAVFWGVLVIGSTGLVLWFPEAFTRIVPGWFVNVATIIHSDEALLAVGFIFTIHFFNTHFRPDKFPMDPVIFTGRVPIAELKYDKPAEYEELVRRGALERNLVDPFPKPAERVAKTFGFIMLGIGLTLIVLIVYAMLFGYR